MAAEREGIEQLEEVHPDFYHHLINTGFIIPLDTDEVEKVKILVRNIDQENDNSYHIIINPTMNCNFKCWYCYETHIKKSKITENDLSKVKKFISSVLNKPNLEYFSLSWFGGEPLLYFNETVLPVLEYVAPIIEKKKLGFSSDFTTNGLLITQEILNQCKKHGVNDFQITLDGHRDRHNEVRFVSKERGSYDEIVKNIKLAVKNELK